jgi:thymidine kinase
VAKLHFKYGAMNSGKTDVLIKTAYNYTEKGLKVIVIKPSLDVKGGDQIVTRSGNRRQVNILAYPETNVREAVKDFVKNNKLDKLSCVLVDEAQLLNDDQVDQLFEIAKQDNISVICYGLRSDFLTKLFPGSKRLFELADNIEKLPTMCSCGSQAEFNCRKKGNVFVFEGDQVAIDGEGDIAYESLCGTCYAAKKQANVIKTQQSDSKNGRILKVAEEGK